MQLLKIVAFFYTYFKFHFVYIHIYPTFVNANVNLLNKHNMKKLFLTALFSIGSFSANAQYFVQVVEKIDYKTHFGYINVGGISGVEFETSARYENKPIVVGSEIQYLFLPKLPSSVTVGDMTFDVTYDKVKRFMQGFNAGVYFRGHLGSLWDLNKDILDPYIGLNVGTNAIGGHIGARYMVTPYIGFYAKAQYNFSGSLGGFLDSEEGWGNPYKNQFLGAAGIVLDLF